MLTEKQYNAKLHKFIRMWRERATKGHSSIECPACEVDDDTCTATNECVMCPINWNYLPKPYSTTGCCSSKYTRISRFEDALIQGNINKARRIALSIANNPRWLTYKSWKRKMIKLLQEG